MLISWSENLNGVAFCAFSISEQRRPSCHTATAPSFAFDFFNLHSAATLNWRHCCSCSKLIQERESEIYLTWNPANKTETDVKGNQIPIVPMAGNITELILSQLCLFISVHLSGEGLHQDAHPLGNQLHPRTCGKFYSSKVCTISKPILRGGTFNKSIFSVWVLTIFFFWGGGAVGYTFK